MADRRKQRKRNAEPAREPKRLSLLDLPPVVDASGDLPTNPGMVLRPERATTLPPAAAHSSDYASLATLALTLRRTQPRAAILAATSARSAPSDTAASAAPSRSSSVPHGVAAASLPEPIVAPQAAPRTEPAAPPSAPARASTSRRRSGYERLSSAPPPVQLPSEAPRSRSRGDGRWGLRTLGVIVLSATVGAIVSSLTWGVKSELAKAAATDTAAPEHGGLATAAPSPACAPAPPLPEQKQPLSTTEQPPGTALATTVSAPRVSFDALPLQAARRAGPVAERVSLDDASERTSRSSTRVERRDGDAVRSSAAPAAPRRESKPAPERTLPVKPSRATLSQSMARAASAATSCDGGPHDGKVAVTFAPSGSVEAVGLVKGFGDAAVNGCVLRAFGRARVPPFSGEPVQVRKSVSW